MFLLTRPKKHSPNFGLAPCHHYYLFSSWPFNPQLMRAEAPEGVWLGPPMHSESRKCSLSCLYYLYLPKPELLNVSGLALQQVNYNGHDSVLFQVTIVIKYFFQFGFFPWNVNLELFKDKPYHPPNIIGVEKKEGYVLYDLLQLLALFFHRSILKVKKKIHRNTYIYRMCHCQTHAPEIWPSDLCFSNWNLITVCWHLMFLFLVSVALPSSLSEDLQT